MILLSDESEEVEFRPMQSNKVTKALYKSKGYKLQ